MYTVLTHVINGKFIEIPQTFDVFKKAPGLFWYRKFKQFATGEERGVYMVLVGKPEGKSHWGDLDVDGWII